MSRIEALVLSTLREFGVCFPDDMGNLESIDRVSFFNMCVQCLTMLGEDTAMFLGCVTDEEDLCYSICNDLSNLFKAGYSIELNFCAFMYPEPDDMTCILTWLASSISFQREQTHLIKLDNSVIENYQIYNALALWQQSALVEDQPLQQVDSSANMSSMTTASQILSREAADIMKERMRYQWKDLPAIGAIGAVGATDIQTVLNDPEAMGHVEVHTIQPVENEDRPINDEVSALQADIIKYNRIYYTRSHNLRKLERKIGSLKRSIEELNHIIEYTETSIFQKRKIITIIDDIDVYLKRLHDSCDMISAETAKEEMNYSNEREEIKKYLADLDEEKRILWEKSQAMLNAIQESRQEIEGITAIIGERKREKEELQAMLEAIPAQSFRDVYMDRMEELAKKKREQIRDIEAVTCSVMEINSVIQAASERMSKIESDIENEMKTIYGSSVDNHPVFNNYSQLKRLFHTFISILHSIMEKEDSISSIYSQLSSIDMVTICKNYDYLLKDVAKLKKENTVVLDRIHSFNVTKKSY